MADESTQVRTVPLSEAPDSDNEEWVIEIMKEEDEDSRPKPLMQQVNTTLREKKWNVGCFDPVVVSLGPYHNVGDDQVLHYKKVAACWFLNAATSNKPARDVSPAAAANSNKQEEGKDVYRRFVEEATRFPSGSPSDCYLNFPHSKFRRNKDFMSMMFLDGCFLLHFMILAVYGFDDMPSKSSPLNQQLIIRDMFLLENQIPYSVLQVLMSLMDDNNDRPYPWGNVIWKFINLVVLPLHERFSWGMETINFFKEIIHDLCIYPIRRMSQSPARSRGSVHGWSPSGSDPHLLDILRSNFVGRSVSEVSTGPPSSIERGYWNYHFRPVMELKAAGIELSRSDHMRSREIEFNQGFIYGHLNLPRIVVDDNTKTLLLNLIAYEMCPDCTLDRTVISYVCFLDSLIYNADDVNELRSKKILYNRLGSDEAVANLFKYLGRNLTPNSDGYYHVMDGIEKHNKRHLNHIRVWIGQLIHTHFTTPWTIISLLAAFFVIFLSLVQTIYTVLSYLKS